MKFLERALLLMYLIGLYFVFLQKPPDYSLIFVSAASFAILYSLTMPLLLQDVTLKDLGNRAIRQRFRWHHLLTGFLFGLFSAYTIYGITFHLLGSMDNIALAENCGIFLFLFAVIGIVAYRRDKDAFYRKLLLRTGLLTLLVLIALITGALKK